MRHNLLRIPTALASQRLRVCARVGRWLNRLVGVLFVSLGLKLGLSVR